MSSGALMFRTTGRVLANPRSRKICIAPDLTLLKCDVAPYFPLPQQLTLVFPWYGTARWRISN